ncbi:MAG: dihydroneopterin aldolase [Sulfurovum sp.]
MTIHIETLGFDVIIGLLDSERITPQRVEIDILASYEYSDGDFINYADIVALAESNLKEEKHELLENALLSLKTTLYTTYPNLQTLYIKIIKPDIFTHCRVGLSKEWEF